MAFFGILTILSSFPVGDIINMGIFKNTYYSSFHALAIFIVIGIAADNIFVFIDGWHQSRQNTEIASDRRRRLPYAFRRAVRATATTSSTTAVAFLANTMSPLMPMRSFGIYCAVLITVNYILLLLFLPPLIIWYEDNLAQRSYLSCCRKPTSSASSTAVADPGHAKNIIQRLFGDVINPIVAKFRWLFIILFAIWSCIAVNMASKLTPLSKHEKFLKDHHPINVLLDRSNEEFGASGIFELRIFIHWGVQDIDKSNVTQWDSKYIGEVVFDPDFNIYSPAA